MFVSEAVCESVQNWTYLILEQILSKVGPDNLLPTFIWMAGAEEVGPDLMLLMKRFMS